MKKKNIWLAGLLMSVAAFSLHGMFLSQGMQVDTAIEHGTEFSLDMVDIEPHTPTGVQIEEVGQPDRNEVLRQREAAIERYNDRVANLSDEIYLYSYSPQRDVSIAGLSFAMNHSRPVEIDEIQRFLVLQNLHVRIARLNDVVHQAYILRSASNNELGVKMARKFSGISDRAHRAIEDLNGFRISLGREGDMFADRTRAHEHLARSLAEALAAVADERATVADEHGAEPTPFQLPGSEA